MKVTQMPQVHAANLVANSGNTAYGVDVIDHCLYLTHCMMPDDQVLQCHMTQKGHHELK